MRTVLRYIVRVYGLQVQRCGRPAIMVICDASCYCGVQVVFICIFSIHCSQHCVKSAVGRSGMQWARALR